ncbi:hypothetical protein KCH_65860 [Kitasatospora cheerisanensis KCTC 2395]|uniref:Uncharacterized protein n=1 Tax=Kitasatospora cheerisanensis KCTC 2395 TaxID=1348663 RepID=A0A066YNS7_9ACTN|nr:hypothetical protein KCH_65860 [Kitasatospora cheerisanensis KCTC 2395]
MPRRRNAVAPRTVGRQAGRRRPDGRGTPERTTLLEPGHYLSKRAKPADRAFGAPIGATRTDRPGMRDGPSEERRKGAGHAG